MGKNFSCNNATGARKESDYYPTPYELTRRFLNRVQLDKQLSILEPACGGAMAIVKVLKEYGFKNVTYFDISTGQDFLDYTEPCDVVITNPPYSLALEFILHAKQLARRTVAMLLPLSYLQGKQRYDLVWSDREFPLSSVYVFTRYPMFENSIRDDGLIRTGMIAYAWYVWERTRTVHKPYVSWIDIDDVILRQSNGAKDNR